MSKRPREDDEEEFAAKWARMEEALPSLEPLPDELWDNEILQYLDSPKELLRFKQLNRRAEQRFPELMWRLYDAHFVSALSGETPRLVTYIKAAISAKTWIPADRRATAAYALVSGIYRATLVAATGLPLAAVAGMNQLMTRRRRRAEFPLMWMGAWHMTEIGDISWGTEEDTVLQPLEPDTYLARRIPPADDLIWGATTFYTTSIPSYPIGQGWLVERGVHAGHHYVFLDRFDPEVYWRHGDYVKKTLAQLPAVLGTVHAREAAVYIESMYPSYDRGVEQREYVFYMTPVLPYGVDDHGPPQDND